MTANMTIIQERIERSDTAKLIRQALKAAFPSTKFRVRLGGGYSTDVSWTDGPTDRQVRGVTDEFESQGFDASTDMRTYNASRLYANADGTYTERRYSSGLLLHTRRWSDEVRDDLDAKMSRITDGATGQTISELEAQTFAWREFAATDYSAGVVA